ncbi:MAG: DUF4860 domain-containing protein [Clostridiales bacterium]|nr:DUF4860 domain-containing protein [Clostridiales bacterium]
MERNRTPKQHMSSLLTLVLFAIFAVCILFVLLTGARIYSDVTARGQDAYSQRTAVQYLSGKLHQAPSGQAVSLTAVEGSPALAITEEIEGRSFTTYVYCHDGWLRELFTFSGMEVHRGDGEKVLPLQSLSLQFTDGLLQVSIIDGQDRISKFSLALRGGKEAAE